ncbi:hypothetical protein D9758_006659 [Tetrapyrgos nigripes]|uniref:Uncharacterized protein n=1 Tax=Tetrapyrgos nigripes TaxID=182062 RepID=A0A8H5GJ20_9AGAR|nr:hypothetical protein D9758_006659 [Tetrapyrgos nigripes]
MVPSTSFIVLALTLCTFISVADVNYVFDIDNAVISPDGYSRVRVVVNGGYPSTLIKAQKDNILHITMNNKLTDLSMRQSTSIHWHGLPQKMDLALSTNVLYHHNTHTPMTYHSHLSSQYVDSLRGPMVIYNPEDPHLSLYDIDDENTVITLEQQTLMSKQIPDSGLINGVGRFNGGPQVPWARINIERGKRYCFCVINIAGYAGFTFSIDKHELTVIEIDGISHKPITVEGFEVFAGQHKASLLMDEENVFAVLHYIGALESADPKGKPKRLKAMTSAVTMETKEIILDKGGIKTLKESNLHPLFNMEAPGGSGPADQVIDQNSMLEWTVNNVRYQPPNLPMLPNIIANNFTSPSQFSPSENTIVLERDQVIELHIHGSVNGHTHPFHLHGHVFSVVQGHDGPANYANPPQRDVVGVKGGTVIICFKTDNPRP